MNTNTRINGTPSEILTDFTGITLAELNGASLMRRKDQKYIFPVSMLVKVLTEVRDNYTVLDISGTRAQSYKTCYFDTSDLDMYSKHHRGMANRYKVRIRRYGKSQEHFLEIKNKNMKGVTTKSRVPTDGMEQEMLVHEQSFLAEKAPYDVMGMEATMINRFRRITLIAPGQKERVTLDYDLRFESERNKEILELPGLAIAEVKYEGWLGASALHDALRRNHVRPMRFSKYAIGMALLHPELKQNRFKQRIRSVNNISKLYHTP